MEDTPDNRFDDLRADHLGEEVRREAEWRRTIADLRTKLKEAQEKLQSWEEGSEPAVMNLQAERDAAIERAERSAACYHWANECIGYWMTKAEAAERDAAETWALAENRLESESELVDACIWNLEQGDHDYCNDVTRVYDRLLIRREDLAEAQEEAPE